MSLALLHGSDPSAYHFGRSERLLPLQEALRESRAKDQDQDQDKDKDRGKSSGGDDGGERKAEEGGTATSTGEQGKDEKEEQERGAQVHDHDLVSPDMAKGIMERQKETYEYHDTLKKLIISTMLTFFLCWNYLWGIVEAARFSVFWELAIVIGLPILGVLGGFERWTGKQEGWLIIVEGVYNLFTVITKLLIIYNASQGNEIMSYMFVGFFFFQVLGFAVFQFMGKLWAGLVMSLTMAVSISIQRYEFREFGENAETANVLCLQEVVDQFTSNETIAFYQESCQGELLGQFLMWGKEAPVMMRLNYLFWVSNVLLVDYSWLLPSIFVPILHYVSVILAWWSGEFWHVRLMTASHLFILDGILLYRRQGPALDWTMLLPHWNLSTWKQQIVPKLGWFLAFCCLLCPIFSFACGQDKLFCAEI